MTAGTLGRSEDEVGDFHLHILPLSDWVCLVLSGFGSAPASCIVLFSFLGLCSTLSPCKFLFIPIVLIMFTESNEEFLVEGARYALPITVQCSISHTHTYTYIHAVTYSTVSYIRSRGAYSCSHATTCVRFYTVRESALPCNFLSFLRKAEKAANCAAAADDYLLLL